MTLTRPSALAAPNGTSPSAQPKSPVPNMQISRNICAKWDAMTDVSFSSANGDVYHFVIAVFLSGMSDGIPQRLPEESKRRHATTEDSASAESDSTTRARVKKAKHETISGGFFSSDSLDGSSVQRSVSGSFSFLK